jgi:nitrate/TMAO reductase-like tetraheme cytochrome c subunit
MKSSVMFLLVTGVLFMGVLELAPVTAGSQETVGEEEKPSFTYVGVKKCKMCHKKETVGAQFKLWEASGHSKAFETLGTPEAAEFAKERGITGGPQEAPECLKCHITAFGLTSEELENSKITLEEGVSCESCHGPGSAYSKQKTMQSITDGELDGASLGLTKPDEKVCVRCHNEESPAYKEFDFETFFKKIAHPRPKETE